MPRYRQTEKVATIPGALCSVEINICGPTSAWSARALSDKGSNNARQRGLEPTSNMIRLHTSSKPGFQGKLTMHSRAGLLDLQSPAPPHSSPRSASLVNAWQQLMVTTQPQQRKCATHKASRSHLRDAGLARSNTRDKAPRQLLACADTPRESGPLCPARLRCRRIGPETGGQSAKSTSKRHPEVYLLSTFLFGAFVCVTVRRHSLRGACARGCPDGKTGAGPPTSSIARCGQGHWKLSASPLLDRKRRRLSSASSSAVFRQAAAAAAAAPPTCPSVIWSQSLK